MNNLWQFQLLGKLSARRGEQIITRFATSRSAALLARLALFPQRAHPREELIDLLWPESQLDAGRLSLRVALASLRRQLEPPDVPPGSVLIADRSLLRLQPLACQCDAVEFESALKSAARILDPQKKRAALDRALALYAGELLPGFYDEWILEERERLQSLYQEGCEQQQRLPAATAVSSAVAAEKESRPRPPDKRGFPIQFTRFFGRAAECDTLAEWLRSPEMRLITLSGPGGSGKTRLATEVIRRVEADFPGPICFVSLADLAEAQFIPGTVGSALGLLPTPSQEPFEQVVAALASLPPALLVLDNYEHLVERGAPLLFSLLSRLPTLTCLVTSRRRLALPGEREFAVPPMALPEENGTFEQVALAASTQLFLDRAQGARPDFQLTTGNAAAVAGLCRKLEGIPLAIELVAARAMSLTPAQMTERLGQRFALLTTRRGDKGTRHRSLWAAIAWSYDLLSCPLQRFFVGLSVFRGGFTVEAAQAVCEEAQALEYLTQLRERSLIIIDESRSGMRFRLLETLREFGDEHLAPDERQALARRHAVWFLHLVEEAGPCLSGPGQALWLDRLEADHENLRLTLAFWLAAPDTVEEGLRTAGPLWRFWSVRGHYASGRDWLARALARPGGSVGARAKAANGAGSLARGQGDYDAAEVLFTEALTAMRSLGNQVAVGSCLCNLGMVAMHRQEYARANTLHRESLTLRREIGDRTGQAYALECLAMVAQHQKDYAQARGLHEESLALWVELGDEGGCLWSIANLAAIASAEGDYETAARLQTEALDLSVKLQDQHALHNIIGNIAALAAQCGDWHRAATLASASEALRFRVGAGMAPNDAAELETALAAIRSGLSESQYLDAWNAGKAMTTEQTVTYARGERARFAVRT